MDRERLVEELTEEIWRRLQAGPRAVVDQVCVDCTGTCAARGRCAFKIPDLVRAGADRIGGGLGMGTVPGDVAKFIDHTLLKPDATQRQVETLCAEAREHRFKSVCVNPTWVSFAADRLAGSGVATCTVIGFPLGANHPEVKADEARRAQDEGATELDMVVNVGKLKSGLHDEVEADIAAVCGARRPGSLVKVILETCLLTDEEKRVGCRLSRRAGADFVKTSTGFSTGGATVGDIALMRAEVGSSMGVKASGGVGDYDKMVEMVQAGATRIGASAGIKIVDGAGRDES